MAQRMVTFWLGTKTTLEGRNMIIFEGDFVRLWHNFNGSNYAWLRVVRIEPYDLCVLSNGATVCASDQYISEAKSADEFINGR
tara:strand:+ start:68 stop:316 length:249 start_codon:yes stop_codon:yes gene_type:complete